ncbi:UNVERIFIED_CONTAM: hypothetical protein RMT77_019731 [Armadillidium vulgare]
MKYGYNNGRYESVDSGRRYSKHISQTRIPSPVRGTSPRAQSPKGYRSRNYVSDDELEQDELSYEEEYPEDEYQEAIYSMDDNPCHQESKWEAKEFRWPTPANISDTESDENDVFEDVVEEEMPYKEEYPEEKCQDTMDKIDHERDENEISSNSFLGVGKRAKGSSTLQTE